MHPEKGISFFNPEVAKEQIRLVGQKIPYGES